MLEQFEESVAKRLGMHRAELFTDKLKLGDVLVMSPTATNSIDLLEAFAAAIAENNLEDQVDIPAFTLDHTVDEVMDEIGRQLSRSEKGWAHENNRELGR